MFVICDVMANSFFFKISRCRNDWTAEFMNGSDFNPIAHVSNAHRGN